MADELVKVSSNDTTAGYLNGKLVADDNLSLTENNDGGNETLSISVGVTPQAAEGRLTFVSDQPAYPLSLDPASSLYYAPYIGNKIALYDGSEWISHTLAASVGGTMSSLSMGSANTNYDIYIYDNSGTLTLEAVAWTNDTTRATAIVRQDGVFCKTGELTKRFLGTARTVAANGSALTFQNTAGSKPARCTLSNYYNKIKGAFEITETTNSWTAATNNVWQAWNQSVNNRLEAVFGDDDIQIHAVFNAAGHTPSPPGNASFGIGIDSTTAFSGLPGYLITSTSDFFQSYAVYTGSPGVGFHYVSCLELTTSANNCTVYGDSNKPLYYQMGMIVDVWY